MRASVINTPLSLSCNLIYVEESFNDSISATDRPQLFKDVEERF